MIPTRVHGILDYVVGVLLIAAPFVFGFADGTPAQGIPVTLGISTLIYSLLTRYELGLIKVIPMPVHLGLDLASGLLLLVSPWLFGFADRVWLPHVVAGAGEILITVLTRRHPRTVR